MRIATPCAIAKGEFNVYYQPRFDVRTLTPVSAEALVRWIPEPRLTPGAFIPEMERNGSIAELTALVMDTVCTDLRHLHSKLGFYPKISVNISPALFRDPSAVPRLAGIVALNGIKSSMIEMEITEGYVAIDVEAVIAAARRFSEAGFEIALDDFGTGMSSLHYLDVMPVSTIKIDRHFISGVGSRTTCDHIVSSMVRLARETGVMSVAEGVETIEQLKYIAGLGCDEAQGFLLARPMPFDDYLNFNLRYPQARQEEDQAQSRILLPQGC